MAEGARTSFVIRKGEITYKDEVEIAGSPYKTTITIAQPDSPPPHVSISTSALDAAERESLTIQLELPLLDLQTGHLPAWQEFFAETLRDVFNGRGWPPPASVRPSRPEQPATTAAVTAPNVGEDLEEIDQDLDEAPREDGPDLDEGIDEALEEGNQDGEAGADPLPEDEDAGSAEQAIRDEFQSIVERFGPEAVTRFIRDLPRETTGDFGDDRRTDDGQQSHDEELEDEGPFR